MKKFFVRITATFFYTGYFPFAPGTFASLAAVGFSYLLAGSLSLYLLGLGVLLVLGFLTSGSMADLVGKKDPGCVVIDEAVGIMISFLFLPFSPSIVWTGFFLFRAFDMFKIAPAARLEKQPGSIGIMMDDVIAGIYTNLTLHMSLFVVSFFSA